VTRWISLLLLAAIVACESVPANDPAPAPAPAPAPVEVAEPKPEPALALTGRRILVVDDEEDVRIFLSTVLEDAGAEVLQASDGDEAIAVMTKERPDFPTLFLRELLSSGIEPPVVPHLLEILAVTRGLAERGRREGVFRRVDPLLFHFGLVGALAFFFATEGPRQRARAAGQLPFEMPTAQAFVRYLEEMTLRGLAPGPSPTRSKKRKGARS